MTDSPEENPFEPPAVAAKREKTESAFFKEWLVGTFFLFVLSTPLYLADLVAGFWANAFAIVVSLRSLIDLRRKQAAEYLQPGDVWMSLGASVLVVGAASVAGTLAFFIAGFAACNADLPKTEDTLKFYVIGIITSVAAIFCAVLYFLGPASVDTLRRRKLTQATLAPNDQGGESRETN
ncbi:hypothetical protein LOC68_26840 [Blastopirellula sp. JC732]|uniref:Uncharacterized protein n=1 Tax=Blastopirellula sediminis TaxID=2894196 RepID=A0A9X1MSM3_9BACT|nr:hypothetical protein [Blastopirellula sediminis]MCC9604675.1 hypothetical protein [Blastopirellula sediminis]MCC9632026.1 hypothetical protein [Blastopirellula sediminis]